MSLSGKSNINPKLWGPYFWETIHFVAYGYPKNANSEDKQVYFSFYENMMKVLPCDKCTNSAQEIFKKSNLKDSLDSRDNLIKWTYLFHKSVNNELGKDSPTLEEFMHNFTNRSNNSNNSNNSTILALLIITLVLLFIYKIVYK
tara:strand:+ start:88 stop:519 length:432 start_codon:yes stop_codon:yes gene_type:complete